MQTGTWIRRGSTIMLLDGGTPAGSAPEEEAFLGDLFSGISDRARQGVDYITSQIRPPSAAPPRAASTAGPPAPRPVAPRSQTRLPVPESALTSLLPAFLDYTYHFSTVGYPWKLPGISVPLAPPKLINCCCFVEAVGVKAWSNTHGAAFTWNSKRHSQMMISTGTDRFSPVAAVIESEMGTAIPTGQPPSAWTVVQGWRSATSGHTFIILDRHASSDRVLTLEANQAFSINGVGYRKLGNLRDFPGARPPARWWENPAVPRWSDILSAYPQGVALAKLNVVNPGWSGLPPS